MLKVLGIDESDTNDRSSILPGYMLKLVIAVAALGVAFTMVIIINALVLDTGDRGGLQNIGSPVVCCASGAMLLLMAGICKDVETPKSCCPKCSRLRTGGIVVLLLLVVPLSHLAFSIAIAGVVLAWLVSVEGVATRLRVVAIVEVMVGFILTEILRRAGAWSDGFMGGILLASYAFSTLFLPVLLILGTVGQRPKIARASCIGCGVAAFHAASIVLSAVSTVFVSFLNNRSPALHDERCFALDLETPLMWFESLVASQNDKEVNLPERYRSKEKIELPCIPQNVTRTTTMGPLLIESEDDDAASLGALVFFLVVAVYAIAVTVTCSCFIKDKMILVTPKNEGEEEEGEGSDQGSKAAEEEEYEEESDEPKPLKARIKACPKACWRQLQKLKARVLSPMVKERIKFLLKQLLGSTARVVVLGIFVMSAIGILVLWDVAVARPASSDSSSRHRGPARTSASDVVQSPNRDPVDSNTTVSNTNFSSRLPDFLGGSNRRVQAQDESPEGNTTTMAPPVTEGPSVDNAGVVGVENKVECFAWCNSVEEDDMATRCKIPGCTRCSTCNLDKCAYWCLDVYPTPVDRCGSLACIGCPECELRPCGEEETTTAAPTPPPRVKRLPSETPLASLPEEYISVTWCSLGPWAAIAVGTVVFSFHVLACSLAGEWASRFEGQHEEETLDDPNSPEAQARMPRPGFSPANMLKRDPAPTPSRLGENNVRIFNI